MSVKGKVKRANERIAELECLLKQKDEAISQLHNDFYRKFNRTVEEVKIKDNILKQLVIRECGGLRGGMNLMVDRCVDDIDFRIDEDKVYSAEFYMRNQKCYTIRIHPKWR